MKKTILTILLAAGVLTANAERFKDAASGFWFEPLDDKTAQTAGRPDFYFDLREVASGRYDNMGQQIFEEKMVPVGEIDQAIINDQSLNWLQYQSGVTCIGPNFRTNIQTIEIPEKVYDNNNKEYTVTAIGDFSFAGDFNSNTKNIILPSSITKLGNGAFYGYCDIENFQIPENVNSLGEQVFGNWKNLKSISIPGSVEKIPDGCFKGLQNLHTVILGEGITEIGESAFEGCTNLDGIEIPGSVNTIKKRAFYGNGSMTWVIFNEGLETIEESAFESTGLRGSDPNGENEFTLVFPNSLTTVEKAAFKNCKNIMEIIFGKRLKDVGDEAFYNVCFREHNCFIPGTITDIGPFGFNYELNVTNFTDLYYPNPNPGDVDRNAFGLITDDPSLTWSTDYWIYATVCLHVPVGTVETYRQKEGWKYFKCIIDDIVVEDEATPTDPLEKVLGYAYIVPGDEINIIKDILPDYASAGIEWTEINGENECITVDKDGNVVGKEFGSKIVLGYQKGENYVQDSMHDKALAGAVIIFVCPTITVVYDITNNTVQDSDGLFRKPARIKSETENLADLMEENITYEHRVVYDSFPKLIVESAPGITLEEIKRAKTYADGEVIEGAELAPIDEEQQHDGDFLVPLNPIVENRIVTLNSSVDMQRVTTGVDSIELSSGIKISVNGYTVTIEGADDNAAVKVVDMNGRVVYATTDKTFEIKDKGLYIITVADEAVKAYVR